MLIQSTGYEYAQEQKEESARYLGHTSKSIFTKLLKGSQWHGF